MVSKAPERNFKENLKFINDDGVVKIKTLIRMIRELQRSCSNRNKKREKMLIKV